MFDSAGNLLEYIGTTADVTERKRAEEALRRSEAYLAEAQRLTHTGSWATDAVPEPLYWSEELFRLYGLDSQDGLPTHGQAMQRVHPEDRDKYVQAFHRVIHQKVDSDVEFRTVLPDGTVKHLHGIGHPVLNANGEVVEVVGTTADITERKRAEETLHESEMRFRTFVDHAADAFFVHDQEHRILDVNRQACENLGYTREQLIGMHPLDFDPVMDAARLQEISERLAAGEVCTFETRHRRKDGSVFPVEVRLRSFRRGGRRLHLASVRDITERKRAEETLRESETRFRIFVDHAGDALFVHDLEQGTIVDVNRQACDSLGYPRQELIGNTTVAFHLDSDRATLRRHSYAWERVACPDGRVEEPDASGSRWFRVHISRCPAAGHHRCAQGCFRQGCRRRWSG